MAELINYETDVKVAGLAEDSPSAFGQVRALHPDLVPLYTLPAFVLTLDDAGTASHLTSRQAKARDWVFTPEVCLGPAFRSLAPPVPA